MSNMFSLVLSWIAIYLSINVDGTCKIEVWYGCSYTGTKKSFTGPARKSHVSDFSNDVISSIKMYSSDGEYCAFYLFNSGSETANEATWYYQLNNGETKYISCLTSIGANDVISTIIIREEKPDCTVELFRDDLFSGSTYSEFGIGQYQVSQLRAHDVPNDAISSMKVIAYPNIDCIVELYTDGNFAGSKAVVPIPRDSKLQTYSFNLQTLQNYGFKNDALSSMIVKPKETIQSVTWLLDETEILTTQPYAMGSVEYDNIGSSSSVFWSKTLTKEETSTWEISYSHTVGVSVEWSVEFGSPIFGAAQSLTVSISYEFSVTSSNSGSTTDSYSETMGITILPGQAGDCEWTMKRSTVDVPFTAVVNNIDGFGQYVEETVGGVWKGVALHDSSVICNDTESPCSSNQNAIPLISYPHREPKTYINLYNSSTLFIIAIFISLTILVTGNIYCCYKASKNRRKHALKKISTSESDVECEFEKEPLQ